MRRVRGEATAAGRPAGHYTAALGIAVESNSGHLRCVDRRRIAFGRRRAAFRRKLSAVSILLSRRRVLCMRNARQYGSRHIRHHTAVYTVFFAGSLVRDVFHF